LREYFPVKFDDAHFCAFDVVMHTALLGRTFFSSQNINVWFILDFKFKSFYAYPNPLENQEKKKKVLKNFKEFLEDQAESFNFLFLIQKFN